MKKIINVLHLSHTDIGYTDTQTRIIKNQINYLKDIIKEYKKNNKKMEKWRWTCESFFIFKKFWLIATNEEKEIFKELSSKKIISISASYLNLAQLASKELYGEILKQNIELCKEEKIKLNSAICNDVNGFSLGYAQELSKFKIKNLFFGLHTHHGMYPAFRKQSPFWWEVNKDTKIFVWVGEHYMMGNEIGLIDSSFGNYVLKSNFENGYFEKKKQFVEGKKRLLAYIKKLNEDNYPFENIPISVLGENTDNAPFNLSISKRIQELNEFYKNDNVEFKMVSIDEFFENIKTENKNIPTYKGDWPDWWSDGTGSTPMGTRIFRQAQRNYTFIKQEQVSSDLIKEIEENLMLYSEHTWGAWSSIEVPFEFWTQEILAIKLSYATRALMLTNDVLDKYSKRRVFKLRNDSIIILEIKNNNKSSLPILLNLNKFLSSKEIMQMDNGFTVLSNNIVLESFVFEQKYMNSNRNQFFCIIPNSQRDKIILIKMVNDKINKITSRTSTIAADGISDVYNPYNSQEVLVHNNIFENDCIRISWDSEKIYSFFNKKTNEELLNKNLEGLFTPIYEESKIPYEFEMMNLKRRWAGRNRKMNNFQRFIGQLEKVQVLKESRNLTIIEFFYKTKGTKYYKLLLEISNSTEIVIATLHIIKDIEWSLQSLYISLPFIEKDDKVLFDKGSMFEIWKDQIPGTLIDYYSIQEGIQIKKKKTNILISSMDANLFWTGPIGFQRRFLAHDKRNKDIPLLYVWAMNTFWETNFNADISGFHEFKFKIAFPNQKNTRDHLRLMNETYLITRKIK